MLQYVVWQRIEQSQLFALAKSVASFITLGKQIDRVGFVLENVLHGVELLKHLAQNAKSAVFFLGVLAGDMRRASVLEIATGKVGLHILLPKGMFLYMIKNNLLGKMVKFSNIDRLCKNTLVVGLNHMKPFIISTATRVITALKISSSAQADTVWGLKLFAETVVQQMSFLHRYNGALV